MSTYTPFANEEMDESALRSRFDACLLTDDEMGQGPEAWKQLAIPFPGWN